jgi:hypothetical protein
MKHNPNTVMAPEESPSGGGIPRNLRTPSNPDTGRIMRALGRLGCWQCPSCNEIYSQDTEKYFSVCAECWTHNESLDEVVDFDAVQPREIAKMYLKFYRTWGLFDKIAPYGNRHNERIPFEFDCLLVLQTWFDEDAIKSALREYDRTTNLYFNAHLCKWTEHGLVPYAAPKPLPEPNMEAWKAIRGLAFSPLNA